MKPQYSPAQGYGYIDPASGYKFTEQGWIPLFSKADVTSPNIPKTPAPRVSRPAPAAPAAPAGNLWSQYKPRLAPITERSESLLRDYLTLQAQQPTFAQKLLDSIKQAGQYPSHAAMREEYMKNPNLTPMAIESLVSRRGQSTRGTIQDIMSRATGGFESDIASKKMMADLAQRERENLLEEYGLEFESQETGKGTAGERRSEEIKRSATSDARGGLNAEDFARKYGGELDDWELINIYNQNSPYGTMAESPQTFGKWTGGKEGKEEALTPGQLAGVRSDMISDLVEDKNRGMDREESKRMNQASYPELTEELEELYNNLWPAEEGKAEEGSAIDVAGGFKSLLDRLVQEGPHWL